MPSNKGFYDGSVILDNNVDNLDVSGWINRKSSSDYNRYTTTVVLNSDSSSLISVGDKLMKSLTNEYLGVVKSVSTATIVFEGGIRCPLSEDDYVHVYPKFEIVKIEILGPETYISALLPVDTRHPGTTTPDLDTWASKTIADFGSVANDGTVYDVAVLPEGSVIEGRFKRVEIDNSAVSTGHAAICYLKASPVIM